jgi:hypothetical protein
MPVFHLRRLRVSEPIKGIVGASSDISKVPDAITKHTCTAGKRLIDYQNFCTNGLLPKSTAPSWIIARLLARRVDGIFVSDFERGEVGLDLSAKPAKGLEGLVSKLDDPPYRPADHPLGEDQTPGPLRP